MRLGEVIYKYRNEHGMSMADFAKISGISKQYISVLERGKHPTSGKQVAPSLEVIKKAAKAMGITFDELFETLDDEVTLNSTEESARTFEERVMKQFNEGMKDKNESFIDLTNPKFSDLKTLVGRGKGSLTPAEKMELVKELLADEDINDT